MRIRADVVITSLLLAACGPRESARPPAAADSAGTPPYPASRVATADGFVTPESVLWDSTEGIWFVSNINGSPGVKDNNGFISRLKGDGSMENLRFIAGGAAGEVLDAPKGMAIVGDTLWVTDIDAVRGFNKRTAAPVATITLGSRAVFLNDLAAGPNGTLYFTDSGIRLDDKGQMTHPGPDRIFAIAGQRVSVAAEGAWLESPNGIAWDGAAARFILAPMGGQQLLAWKPGVAKVDTIGTGPGGQDGVERMADGRLLISSWADSSVFALANGVNTRVVSGLSSPADIGLDPARGWLAIPIMTENRVEFWKVRAQQ